jgi:hypothetical protein
VEGSDVRANAPAGSYPDSLATRPLFDIELVGESSSKLGELAAGELQVDRVHGGFHGQIRGRVRHGTDWLLQDKDGVFRPDARILLEVDDGSLIEMRYRGVACLEQAHLAALMPGGALPPYYHRTSIRFRTSAAAHRWLNAIVAIGFGRLFIAASGVPAVGYRVFHVL